MPFVFEAAILSPNRSAVSSRPTDNDSRTFGARRLILVVVSNGRITEAKETLFLSNGSVHRPIPDNANEGGLQSSDCDLDSSSGAAANRQRLPRRQILAQKSLSAFIALLLLLVEQQCVRQNRDFVIANMFVNGCSRSGRSKLRQAGLNTIEVLG